MELRAAIIAAQAAHPTSPRYHDVPADVSGLHRVPIVGITRTQPEPLVNGEKAHGPKFGQVMDTLRASMREAGRGDEDARAVMFLHVIETAWYKAQWCWNVGNRKVRPIASAQTINAGFVYTENPCDAVYILQDMVQSIDFYPAFDSFANGLAEEKRFFERNHNYAGVLDAYRAGDIAGCKRASEIMHNGGYSSNVLAARFREIDSFWAYGARTLGAAWVR